MPVTQRATQIVHGSSLDPDFETTDEHEAHGHHAALYFDDWIEAYLRTHRRFRTDEGRKTEHANLTHFIKQYEAMRSSVGVVVAPDGVDLSTAIDCSVNSNAENVNSQSGIVNRITKNDNPMDDVQNNEVEVL